MSASLKIPVLVGSVRRNRQSPRVARWLQGILDDNDRVSSELLDLEELALPIMEERLRMRDDPPTGGVRLSEAVAAGDGLVIVTPEYNSGYPGVLKNALDYLLPELKRKPVGIVTVSAGGFGGASCLAQLRQVLLAMGAAPIPASLPISRVAEAFDQDGPSESAIVDRAARFVDELLWWVEAVVRQRAASP